MVIDWVGQNIIWSDSKNGIIELVKIDKVIFRFLINSIFIDF